MILTLMEIHLKCVLFAAVLAMACLVVSEAGLRSIKYPVRQQDGGVSFLVIGDWGRKGLFNQSQVAAQMGKIGEKVSVDFVLSTGDNFYDHGLTGVDDPAFSQSFSNIYTSQSLQVPWFTVLGNHDYRGDVEAQLSPALSLRDKRWLCFRSFIVNAGVVDFFLVDTTPFVDKYFSAPGDQKYDWRGVLPRKKYISTLLKDLSSALENSRAKWKMVVGHHTIKSAGHHGVTSELTTQLEPILKKYKVDLYLNGHDHCLEHITSINSNTHFVTSGGGSKAWRGDMHKWNPRELKFYYDGQGFLSAQVNQSTAKFAFYDVNGDVLHQWDVAKPPHSVV